MGPTNVAIFSDVTVNRIEFDNALHPYIVSGSETVNLETDSIGTTSRIDVVNGNHQFQAKFALIDDATIDVASGSSLEFVNRLELNGNTLTKTGAGTLVISNTLNTGGGTLLHLGGVLSGGGTIGGDVSIHGGTISPGTHVSGLTRASGTTFSCNFFYGRTSNDKRYPTTIRQFSTGAKRTGFKREDFRSDLMGENDHASYITASHPHL